MSGSLPTACRDLRGQVRDFARGLYQDISAGVYLPAAGMGSAVAEEKAVRLRVSKDCAYAGEIRDGG